MQYDIGINRTGRRTSPVSGFQGACHVLKIVAHQNDRYIHNEICEICL